MNEVESEYVKLISSDGFEFVIHREAAIRSGTIKNMISGPGKKSLVCAVKITILNAILFYIVQFRESVDNEITFRDIK